MVEGPSRCQHLSAFLFQMVLVLPICSGKVVGSLLAAGLIRGDEQAILKAAIILLYGRRVAALGMKRSAPLVRMERISPKASLRFICGARPIPAGK